jgi:hypothetical protein
MAVDDLQTHLDTLAFQLTNFWADTSEKLISLSLFDIRNEFSLHVLSSTPSWTHLYSHGQNLPSTPTTIRCLCTVLFDAPRYFLQAP